MEVSPLDALLTEDQLLMAQAVSEFASDAVAGRHEAWDHAGTHPEDLWSEIAELGLFGVFIPEDLGGAGAGFLTHVVAVDLLAGAAGLAGALLTAQGIVVDTILRSGEEEVTARHLEGLATGEILGAPALLEDDPDRVACLATGEGPAVILTGEKLQVPFPGRAGVYVVKARRAEEDVLVAVDAGASGAEHVGPLPNLGFSGFETGPLTLRETPGVLLGGSELVEQVITGARIAVAALLGGTARGAIGHATRYSLERKQFKLELRRFGAIQERLSRSDARLEALRALVHNAARSRDGGAPCVHGARRARQFAAEVAVASADDAVQIYGGYGYSREYPVERAYRDARFPGFGEYHLATLIADSADALD